MTYNLGNTSILDRIEIGFTHVVVGNYLYGDSSRIFIILINLNTNASHQKTFAKPFLLFPITADGQKAFLCHSTPELKKKTTVTHPTTFFNIDQQKKLGEFIKIKSKNGHLSHCVRFYQRTGFQIRILLCFK